MGEAKKRMIYKSAVHRLSLSVVIRADRCFAAAAKNRREIEAKAVHVHLDYAEMQGIEN